MNQIHCPSCRHLSLDERHCSRCGERIPSTVDLRTDIAHVLNCYSAENASNTPDFILAQYLTSCLAAFDEGVRQREVFYGIKSVPGGSTTAVAVPSPAAMRTHEP